MKVVSRLVAVALLFVAVAAYGAAKLEGNYTLKAQYKGGQPQTDWQGTMTIKGTEMKRDYVSGDKTKTKYLVSTMTADPKVVDVWVVKHTKAYKPEYVGNEFRNKINLTGATLTIESEDGTFKEVWEVKK